MNSKMVCSPRREEGRRVEDASSKIKTMQDVIDRAAVLQRAWD
jgi:hypothetical protein